MNTIQRLSSEAHDHHHGQNRWAVIPTREKLNADPDLRGRGVTVAFLDSGFVLHPDIEARIIEFHDVAGEERDMSGIHEPRPHHWHGTQTVVSCAGEGALSDGVYRGLASESNLVLVKASENGMITDRTIEAGLEWVLEHRQRLGIRVLNLSLGGDANVKTVDSRINTLAERLTDAGVVITVAAGNDSGSKPIPPASAPSVITVGGYSDCNSFDEDHFDLYHSTFGATSDGLIKPEVIAPAMYVAAPILPGTDDYRAAEALSALYSAPDYLFAKLLPVLGPIAGIGRESEPAAARTEVESHMQTRKIVAAHYQHVDGTSFAAPIAASIVAQMLEANPGLTPSVVKNILVSTARRLAGFPSVRQGFGIVNAAAAVAAARSETHFLSKEDYSPPRIEGRRIVFSFHDDNATDVKLVGNFNDWNETSDSFYSCRNGLWCASTPCLPKGRYAYKFLVDGKRWTEDGSHGLKEEDGFGGFNSILDLI
ncbi:MAG: serine protease [Acidobacteria bacterium]|nr:MAG: serine protease [Acidobacteriota bacterium]REJ97962.1 MAG: serine protease [Acidobacteriota bacterium]REK16705.1 MAG: serine protease [Acidobacteriota bacterium]REK42616.1 MAG: serine protease [Acidobacteriota bacterium]